MIHEKMKYPTTSDFDLRKLKLEKLQIKEEMERFSTSPGLVTSSG